MGRSVRTVVFNDLAVVHVTGDLDLGGVPDLREELARLAHADENDVVVDLTDVTFLDTTGIGVLVAVWNKLRRTGGRLELVVEDSRVMETLRIAGLEQVFTVHRSVNVAREARETD